MLGIGAERAEWGNWLQKPSKRGVQTGGSLPAWSLTAQAAVQWTVSASEAGRLATTSPQAGLSSVCSLTLLGLSVLGCAVKSGHHPFERMAILSNRGNICVVVNNVSM